MVAHTPLQIVWCEEHFGTHPRRLHIWPFGQTLPQAPQLSWSFANSWQASPQKVSPDGHRHALDRQVWPEPHGRPHAPQLLLSLSTLAHPLPHAVRLPGQTHVPPRHGSPDPHAVPQVPQLSGSKPSPTQCSPQSVAPAGQVQVEFPHTCVVTQAVSHAPQWNGSAVRSTQLCLQAVNLGAAQIATQEPAWQKAVAPLQVLPQAPQFLGSLATSMHVSLQRSDPTGHVHTPAAHACPVGHDVPHVPQFAESFVESTQAAPQIVRPTAQGAWQAPFEHRRPASQT